MKKLLIKQIFNDPIKIGLFIVVLTLGTMVGLVVDETLGLAQVDLADVPFQAIATRMDRETQDAAPSDSFLPNGALSLHDTQIEKLAVGADSRMYTLTNDGLFVSEGDTWQKLESVPEVPVSLAIAATDVQVLYAGGSSNGIYRSADGGQSWDQVNAGLKLTPGAALRVTAIVVDEQDAQHVIAATAYGLGKHLAPGSIYESDNGGRRWIKIADVDDIVTKLIYNNGTIYATTAKGLKRYGEPIEFEPVLPGDLSLLADSNSNQFLFWP